MKIICALEPIKSVNLKLSPTTKWFLLPSVNSHVWSVTWLCVLLSEWIMGMHCMTCMKSPLWE